MKRIYILEIFFLILLMAAAGILYTFTVQTVDRGQQYRHHCGYVVGESKEQQWKLIRRTNTQDDIAK